MMRRLSLLVRKETREHAWALALIAVALGFILGLRWLLTRMDERQPSEMAGAQALILVFVPVAGLILGHRLVVREYQAKTQLFLEALPLRRSELVLVKFLFGLAVLCLMAWTSIGVFAILSHDATPRFLLILAMRAFGFALACWTLFFSMGLLGRLRFAAYVTLALGAFALRYLTAFEFERFGPFALINDVAFAYERSRVPWRAFLETLASSAVLLAPGLVIALAREGSLAERLTRRSSAREASAIVALIGVELMLVSWAGMKRRTPPFEFNSAQVTRSKDGRVAIMYGFPELEPRARELLGALENLESRLRPTFSIEPPLPVRIAQSGLLGGRDVHLNYSDPDAVLLEVNLGARGFVATNVLMNVAHAKFVRASKGRAAFEPNHWLLDGMASFVARPTESPEAKLSWLRAAVATRRIEPSRKAISEWEQLMEHLGETQAEALAFTLVDFLRQRHGAELVLSLARPTLGGPSIDGLVSWLRLHDRTVERRFEELTHEPFAAYLLAFRHELRARAAGPELNGPLERIPFDSVRLRLRPGSLGPEVEYSLSGAALDRDRDCVLLHGLLRPYDVYYPPQQLTTEQFRVARGETRFVGVLRGRYAVGQRIFAAIECEVPELQSRERLAVARLGAR